MNHQIQPPLCIWGNGHLAGSPDTEQHSPNFIVQSCGSQHPRWLLKGFISWYGYPQI